MTKRRIPWSEGEIDDLMSMRYIRPITPDTWKCLALIVNYENGNARTPAACRRKYGRIKMK